MLYSSNKAVSSLSSNRRTSPSFMDTRCRKPVQASVYVPHRPRRWGWVANPNDGQPWKESVILTLALCFGHEFFEECDSPEKNHIFYHTHTHTCELSQSAGPQTDGLDFQFWNEIRRPVRMTSGGSSTRSVARSSSFRCQWPQSRRVKVPSSCSRCRRYAQKQAPNKKQREMGLPYS